MIMKKDYRLIFATSNENKMREIRMILSDLDMPILSMKDAGIDVDIVETGETFAENARIKAMAVSSKAGLNDIVLADDSGLVVDYIGGEPGVYSARYMGRDVSYDIKNLNIIDRLKDAKEDERTARFVCAIVAVFPDGSMLESEGVVEGVIAHEPAGNEGFGYDPIFYLPERGMTTAQLPPEEKNAISHRGRALTAMRAELMDKLQEDAR